MVKRKLLFIVEAMGGGVFTYIVNLANELTRRYKVFIAYALRPQTPENYREHFDPSIKLIKVNYFTRSINPYKDLFAVKEIIKIVQSIQPDIIHLHSSKAGVIGRIALFKSKTPLFYTPHGYSFLMKNCNLIKRKMFKEIESLLAKSNCITISCSIGEHRETLLLTSRARWVNNGINTYEIDKYISCAKKTNHPFTVYTTGRICYQKNPSLFNLIAASMPDIHFLWIGDGELREELTSDNIEITGWMDREEALKRSINADVFLLPSLWEGLSMSLLEAMYLQKLCVVSNAIGNRDVIHSGINGFVCQTLEEYRKSILFGKTDEIIQNAHDDIVKIYNTEVMAKGYFDIYENSIKRE